MEEKMEEKNNILSKEDIINLCLDFYMIGRSGQPFLDEGHLREAIKNSIKTYIEFRNKHSMEVKK